MTGNPGSIGSRAASIDETEARPYRPCVGVMLLDKNGQALVGARIDTPGDHWQMPQGGIETGEAPADAARRELREEVGTSAAQILAESNEWLRYDLPLALSATLWGGRYRGQEQKWFLMRFLGCDADIRLDGPNPEFSRWRWVWPDALPSLIVPFKRRLYARVVAEFAPLIAAFRTGAGASR